MDCEEEEVRIKKRGRSSSSFGVASAKMSTDRQSTIDGRIVMMPSSKRSHHYKKKTSPSSSTATNDKSFTSRTAHSSLVPGPVTGPVVNGTNTRDNGCHGNSRYGSSSVDAIRIDDDEEFDKLCSCIDLTLYK